MRTERRSMRARPRRSGRQTRASPFLSLARFQAEVISANYNNIVGNDNGIERSSETMRTVSCKAALNHLSSKKVPTKPQTRPHPHPAYVARVSSPSISVYNPQEPRVPNDPRRAALGVLTLLSCSHLRCRTN